MLAELDALYDRGWRGSEFIVDDNFIGHKRRVKRLLRQIIDGYRWIMNTIYSPEMYYKRIIAFLRHYRPSKETHLAAEDSYAFLRSMW